MFKAVLLSITAAATVVLGTTTQSTAQPRRAEAAQPRMVEAAHCTFWACSDSGETYPTERVCMHNCATGACSPIDVCN